MVPEIYMAKLSVISITSKNYTVLESLYSLNHQNNQKLSLNNIIICCLLRYVQENIQFHELEPMYRQFHRILEAFKITEKKDDTIKEEDKETLKPSKPLEKVQDQFAADEEAVEVIYLFLHHASDVIV